MLDMFKKYREQNKDKRRQYDKEYREKNKQKIKEKDRERYKLKKENKI